MVGFLFGAGTGETAGSLKRKRETIEALQKQIMGSTPKNTAEGIAALMKGVGAGIGKYRLDKTEREGAADFTTNVFNPLIEGSSPFVPAAMGNSMPKVDSAGNIPATPSTFASDDIKGGIAATATSLGIDPVDLATAISYETAGTFDPRKKGPRTQWGQHEGLIQFGEPQAKKYGVDWENPVTSQLGADGAVAKYLKDAGVQPGMGMMDIYSAINAGRVGRYNASDANNGGAPGTVADKVNQQMAGHRAKALAMFADAQPQEVASLDPSVGIQPMPVDRGAMLADPSKIRPEDAARLASLRGDTGGNTPYTGPGAKIDTPMPVYDEQGLRMPGNQPQTAAAAIEAISPTQQPGSLSDEVAAFQATPEYASQFPGRQNAAGAQLRPFRPDERRPNPDGSYSTEITTTWQTPDGKWVNVPSLWMGPNGPQQFDPSDEDGILSTMQGYEGQNGPTFQRFDTVEQAEQAAQQRSKMGGAGANTSTPQQARADSPFVPAEFRNSPQVTAATGGIVPALMGGTPATQEQVAQSAQVGQQQPLPQESDIRQAQSRNALGVDPRLIRALSSPFIAPEQRAVLQTLADQQMQESAQARQLEMKRSDPAYQLDLEKSQLELNALRNPQPGYQVLTADERQQLGIPATDQRVYQKSRDGQISAVGGVGQTINVGDKLAERRAAAESAGLKPDDPRYQSFLLTGDLPKENQQRITATDKQAILEADDMVAANQNALLALGEAEKLSDQANAGWLASTRASIGNNLPDLMVPDFVSSPESSKATTDMDNAVIGQALASLKTIFGGNPTEGERAILLELQGSSGMPREVRKSIFARAKSIAEKRMAFNRDRAAELRSGDYFKSPDAGQPMPANKGPVSIGGYTIEEVQ